MTKSEERILELDEEYEELMCQRHDLESRVHRGEVDADDIEHLSDRMSDIVDKMTTNRRIRAFHEGHGFTVTLRVMPERWMNDDPGQWDWQELLDMEAVVLVDSHPVGAMDHLKELLQATK